MLQFSILLYNEALSPNRQTWKVSRQRRLLSKNKCAQNKPSSTTERTSEIVDDMNTMTDLWYLDKQEHGKLRAAFPQKVFSLKFLVT